MTEYLKDALFSTAGVIWVTVAGILSVAGFVVPSTVMKPGVRVALIIIIALATGIGVVLARGYSIYQEGSRPVPVRLVEPGRHYRHDTLMIVLDRRPWIKFDQLLTLVESSDDLGYPIALLRVTGFTTRRHPQCALVASLTDRDLPSYLLDRSRWRSLEATSVVQSEYLEMMK